MAISHVQSVTVPVSDEDKAIDFYVNKLGFEKRSDQTFNEGLRWIEVAPPGAQTLIILARGYGDDTGKIGKFAGIVLTTPNMRETYETLRDKGVKFTETPSLQPWGMLQAQFEDQDGNGFVLVGPPQQAV